VVELERPVAEALREHRAQVASRNLQAVAPEARVVTKRDGGVMRPDNLTRRWESALRRFNADPATAVLPRISLHGLRHTHASHLLAAGVPVHTVSERLGHDAVVLLRTYAHAMPSAQQDGLAKLAAYRMEAKRRSADES
jgi:integrase